MIMLHMYLYYFFFNDTATTEIYTLSLHDALPIYRRWRPVETCRERRPQTNGTRRGHRGTGVRVPGRPHGATNRSEEHTSELQSRLHIVCRLLLEKKKNTYIHQ